MKKWVVDSAAVGLLWVVISVVWAPAYMVATTPYRVDQNPGNRGLPFQRINIPSGDLSLEGWWIPAESPRAELIFVHGAGSNRISQFIGSLDFYLTLHELGVSVITMDLRNHGNSPVTDGVLRMGAAEWPDVIAAAAWLDQHQASGLPRVALGASMGGSTVIHAITHGLDLDAAILLDPLLDVIDSMQHGGRVVTGIPSPFFAVAARAAISEFQLPHGEHSPLALGSRLKLPILLIQDWDDPVTRSPFAERLSNENPFVTLRKVPAISPDAPCLEGKHAWGSHVAAHPCHPEWTRHTVSAFIDSVLASS